MRILKFITYSFGNFANTIAYQVFGNRINFYYVDVLGLNAGVAGILWSIYGFWNAINDPLVGQVSDRTRSRVGRRVPYVALGAVPLGLSFFFLWTPPSQSPFALLASFILAPILAEEVGYFTMGAIMGTLIAAGYLIAMIGVKEKPADETQEQTRLVSSGTALHAAHTAQPAHFG
jgi:GPH family glycoside/pentoside/hexuronide:cation symporter